MKKIFQILCAVLFLAGMTSTAQAQCTFSSSFGSASINTAGSVVTISTCSFAGEFSTVSGAVAGQTLKFTSAAGDFVTVHAGSSSGPVVAFGPSPLTFSNTFTGTLFPTWSLAGCGTQSTCRTTTVQCVGCVSAPGPCTFSSSFGSAAINNAGQIVTISTCSFGGEFSTVTGAVAGQVLKFTSSVGTDWITVHAGSSSGPVLAVGLSPLSFTNTFTGTIFPTWATNSLCGTQSTCRTTTVQCVSCLPPPPPANDLCGGAISLNCGASVNGSTATGATPDNATAPFCGTAVGTGGGVWYKVIGNGGFITANTCGGQTNYDTKLHVYSGNCGALSCVGGNDDFCGLSSSVTWCAQSGTPYFVLVNGFSAAQGDFTLNISCVQPTVTISSVAPQCLGGASVTLSASFPGGTFSGPGVSGNTFNPAAAGVGTHTITYTVCSVVATTTITVLAPPSNDACANAAAIDCGRSPQGSTTCATIDAGLPFCGTTGGTAGGNWYKFTGDGGNVTLSTCNAFTNYDTKLHVFAGSCGSLTCVAGNDDYSTTNQTCSVSSLRSIVKFCTTPGTQYYVLVHGFSSSTGNYQLDMSCVAPLSVDAGACQTRFLGYTGAGAPDDTLYICPTITGGAGPYTTTISPAAAYRCNNGCFAVAPSANTTYTITVTDANGCSATDNVLVQVIDVVAACGSNGQPKVQVCHVPPGNPGNEHNICISPNAVPAHIVGGGVGHSNCYLGPCGNPCRATNPACAQPSCGGGAFTVTISGTGFLDETSWSFGGTTGGSYAFGTTNSTTVVVPSGNPSTFSIETQGSFNDNVASYTISCGGNVILTGTIQGGQTLTQSGICCGGQIAPKMAEQKASSGIVAFPNPFSDVTTFRFRSAKNGHASIVIFNLAGSQVATVFDGPVSELGTYEARFDASGLSAGSYLYRYINADGQTSMGKVSLMK